jgi:hypothetical protein
MPTKQVKCKVTVASGTGAGATTKDYFFLAPKGMYTGDIAGAVGIAEASATEQDEPIVTVKELLRSCRALRLNASAKTAAGKVYSVTMLCAPAKFAGIRDALKGKHLTTEGAASNGSTIFSVRTQTETNLS